MPNMMPDRIPYKISNRTSDMTPETPDLTYYKKSKRIPNRCPKE